MSKTIKTKIHAYRYDVTNPVEAKAYAALCARMEAQDTKCFESWGVNSHYQSALDGIEVELETMYVFDNQWNTAPIPGVTDKGLRVFDWALDYKPDGWEKSIKQGHYLDLTPEMIEVRENRLKCGYCGKQYDKRDTPAPPMFCTSCLGSEYLREKDLYLTRIGPVKGYEYSTLTAEELEVLLPVYKLNRKASIWME